MHKHVALLAFAMLPVTAHLSHTVFGHCATCSFCDNTGGAGTVLTQDPVEDALASVRACATARDRLADGVGARSAVRNLDARGRDVAILGGRVARRRSARNRGGGVRPLVRANE